MFKHFYSMALFAMLCLTVVGNAEVHAQTLKVGMTDHEVLIANMPEYRDAQLRMQQEYQSAQEVLQSLAADLQTDLAEYQSQQRMLSAESKAIREQELAIKEQELQLAAAKKDEDLANLEVELMAPIGEKVQNAINEVATSKGLDLVIRYQVGSQPVILFANPDSVEDITLEVAVKLGIDVSAAQAAADSISASQ